MEAAVDAARLHASYDGGVASMCLSDADSAELSFDELAVVYGALWVQYHLLKNGLAAGSITMVESQPSDPFDMRSTLRRYEERLCALSANASDIASDFAAAAGPGGAPVGPGYLFGDRFLRYLATAIMSDDPVEGNPLPDSSLLTVIERDHEDQTAERHVSYIGSSKRVDRGTYVRHLEERLGIRHKHIGGVLFQQLVSTGMITLCCGREAEPEQTEWVDLNLPTMLEPPLERDDLVGAIEALLSDIDLAQNEQGLRMLFDRAFPSQLYYGDDFERLGRIVVAWLLNEVCIARFA
jgi:hypothetical protein